MISNKKKTAFFIILAVFFVCLDRFLKSLAVADVFNFDIWGKFLQFNFASNPNIAFSLPISGIFLNIMIPIILVIIIMIVLKTWRENNLIDSLAMVNIFLGAVSNYYDRLIYGYVIDFFDMKYFTIFNVADIMIVVGAIVIIANNFKKDAELKIKT